jgi:flagellar hook-associated protein 1 FlgK
VAGLFSTFSVATRGMYVAQKTIDVTSHNIANANTEGYSRQRATIETTRPFGMPSINSVAEPGQLGTGAQISAIQRVRDIFLDFQVRNETSTLGQYSARENYLSNIESIVNEPTDTGISTLIGKFYDSWQELSKQPQSSNARTVVAQQSLALTNELNHTYNQLQKLKTNAEQSIDQVVVDVNSMLGQINQLNQEIVAVKVAGKEPNDLMDKRDLLLDKLSAKFNINVDRKNLEGIDLSSSDEPSNSKFDLVNAIVDGNEKRFSYINTIDDSDPNNVVVTYYKLGDMASSSNELKMTLTGMSASDIKDLKQCRVLWANTDGQAVDTAGNVIKPTPPATTPKVPFSTIKMFKPTDGELKGYMSIQTDVDKYIEQVNVLAKTIAFTVNAVHSGTNDASIDNTPFFVNSKDVTKESEITAGNITVNKDIVSNPMIINVGKNFMLRDTSTTPIESDADYITRLNTVVSATTLPRNPVTEPDSEYVVRLERAVNKALNGETDNKRALAVAALRDALIEIQNVSSDSSCTRKSFINFSATSTDKLELEYKVNGMKIDRYFKDTVNKLGVQAQEAKRMVTNQESLLSSFEESRLSISGVSLDEEMANLVQYQHAYTANAKMISTIDELLDVVVNGLKK